MMPLVAILSAVFAVCLIWSYFSQPQICGPKPPRPVVPKPPVAPMPLPFSDFCEHVERVEAFIADKPDIRIVRTGGASKGWDRMILLACGQTEYAMLIAYGMDAHGTMIGEPDEVVNYLRKVEARRAEHAEAVDGTMARFYV